MPPQVHIEVFPLAELAPRRKHGAPICWMWGQLMVAARRVFGSQWTLLLGDDVWLEPADWPAKLAGEVRAASQLSGIVQCLAAMRW